MPKAKMTKEEAFRRFKHSLEIKKALQDKLKQYEGINIQNKFQKDLLSAFYLNKREDKTIYTIN